MNIEQSTNFHHGTACTIQYNEPELCPLCHHSIKPEYLTSTVYKDNRNNLFFSSMLLCKHCYRSFIVFCSVRSIGGSTYQATGNYEIAPVKYIEEQFDPHIIEISPDFVEIYNQAMSAESFGLNQISGIGLRKALEFLIKDFLVLKNPDEITNIEKMPLQQCIERYIEDHYLKAAASRAVWLGNDQTHYVQKFENKDIKDLKNLIAATIHWILMLHITEEAESMEP